jgi:protein-arginine kinase activator protein McsA
MPESPKILCESCHEREATYHMTKCSPQGMGKSDLCPACFESLSSPEERESVRRFEDSVAHGKCKYCGASPVCGSSAELWCEECRKDLAEFMSRPESGFPSELPTNKAGRDKLVQTILRTQAEADKYVRDKVAKRKPKA